MLQVFGGEERLYKQTSTKREIAARESNTAKTLEI